MDSLIGGLDPSRSLSVALDVGTNNPELLNDPLYVVCFVSMHLDPSFRSISIPGLAREAHYRRSIRSIHRQVKTRKVFFPRSATKLLFRFIQLVRRYYPHSLLHFEDFGVKNANRLLHKYRDTHAVFNDDRDVPPPPFFFFTYVISSIEISLRLILSQGTGAVALSCIMAAINVNSHQSKSKAQSKLSDQRYVIFGAGSAGMGIAVQIRDAMVTTDGISREEANSKFWAVDREGLLYERDVGTRNVDQYRSEFVRSAGEGWSSSSIAEGDVSLLEVVERVKPTVLIGCSTAPGTFTKEVVEAMMRGLENDVRPIIMPLSNPSRLVEARPADILQWTNGRALVATGSPFGTVKMEVGGEKKEFV
jgi:malate dehydrogenase (oxaloacetate-decarboxylating)